MTALVNYLTDGTLPETSGVTQQIRITAGNPDPDVKAANDFIVFQFTIVSCSSSKKKKVDSQMVPAEDSALLKENYVKLCYGMATEADTSNFMEHAMQLLNASDYRGCLALFKTKYPKLDTVIWHSGFYGLIIPDSNIQS